MADFSKDIGPRLKIQPSVLLHQPSKLVSDLSFESWVLVWVFLYRYLFGFVDSTLCSSVDFFDSFPSGGRDGLVLAILFQYFILLC